MKNAPIKQKFLGADNDENCAKAIKLFYANVRQSFRRDDLCLVAAQKNLACLKDLRDDMQRFHPGLSIPAAH